MLPSRSWRSLLARPYGRPLLARAANSRRCRSRAGRRRRPEPTCGRRPARAGGGGQMGAADHGGLGRRATRDRVGRGSSYWPRGCCRSSSNTCRQPGLLEAVERLLTAIGAIVRTDEVRRVRFGHQRAAASRKPSAPPTRQCFPARRSGRTRRTCTIRSLGVHCRIDSCLARSGTRRRVRRQRAGGRWPVRSGGTAKTADVDRRLLRTSLSAYRFLRISDRHGVSGRAVPSR